MWNDNVHVWYFYIFHDVNFGCEGEEGNGERKDYVLLDTDMAKCYRKFEFFFETQRYNLIINYIWMMYVEYIDSV